MAPNEVNEELLYFIWQFQLFDKDFGKGNSPFQIVKQGERNFNAGPDFFNARIKIGDTEWAGNVEIHVKTSDWYKHNHHEDKSYKNVILHVVYINDIPSKPLPGNIPVLELRDKVPAHVIGRYNHLRNNLLWIPCAEHISTINEISIAAWLDRMVVERLEQKQEYVLEVLNRNQNNWQETFYQLLAKNFGFKVNSLAFEKLALSLPLKTLSLHKDNLLQLEALLFGQAGFLADNFEDVYFQGLKKEYKFLKIKYGLKPGQKFVWKLLRLRPANFPGVRISQFAALIHHSQLLFSKVLEAENANELLELFKVQASPYWNNHFTFDKESAPTTKRLGNTAVYNILINTVVPVLFTYGSIKKQEKYKEKALSFLEELKPEQNNILNKWKELGIQNQNAFHSQGLLQLKNNYCNQKKCLNCAIGTKLLKKLAVS